MMEANDHSSEARNLLTLNSNKSIDQFNMNDFYETYQNKFITNLANTYATQKVSRDLKNDKVWDQVQKINLENRKAAIDIRKEKAKARITDRKPENLLKRRMEYYKAFNIEVEDIVNVPDFFDRQNFQGKSILNLDVIKGKIGDLIDNQETILKKVPAGGTKIKTTVPDPNNEGKTITKECSN